MGLKDQIPSGGGLATFITRVVVRFLQFILAITAGGIYGHCVTVLKDHHDSLANCTYAVVIAGISAVTCIVYMIPLIKSYVFFAWDALLFILWVAVFGAFGKIYINRGEKHSYHHLDTDVMKHAVWLDLVNMLLWFITATYGAVVFIKGRKINAPQKTVSEV